MPKIAVVGGGPKGVAIAAKAFALARTNYSAPDITIYEQGDLAIGIIIGAAFTGVVNSVVKGS